MALSTTYGDGGMTTTTESSPYPTGGGEDDFWRHLASRRMMPTAPVAPPRGPSGPGRSYAGPSRQKAEFKGSGSRDNTYRQDDFGPPLKFNSGPGIIPGYSMDPLKMNAAQRRAYLPNNATMSPGEDADAEARRRALLSSDFNRFGLESQQRQGGF